MSAKNDAASRGIYEFALMARGLLALVKPTTDVRQLIDADNAIEISRNIQLQEAPSKEQERVLREYAATFANRLRLLRRNVFWSFVILTSAVALSLLFSHLAPAPTPSSRIWLGGASIFCFAWATLARLGWSERSWDGDSVVERLDERIFKFLYWLGSFLGILALA